MGQLKKLVPKSRRDQIFNYVDEKLPENGFVRDHFADGISVLGTVFVGVGAVMDAKGFKKTGLAVRSMGHAADDLDGDTARRLGTAGRKGALVDATLDKFKVLTEIGVMWKHTKSDMDQDSKAKKQWMLAFIAAKHVTNSALNVYIESTGKYTESSKAGKTNMWADGLTFAAWGVADTTENQTTRLIANGIADVSFVAGAVLGVVSAKGYLEQARA